MFFRKKEKKEKKEQDKQKKAPSAKSGSPNPFGLNLMSDVDFETFDKIASGDSINDIENMDDDELLAELGGGSDEAALAELEDKPKKPAPKKKSSKTVVDADQLTLDDISDDGLEDELNDLMSGEDLDDSLPELNAKVPAATHAPAAPAAATPQLAAPVRPQQQQKQQQKPAGAPSLQQRSPRQTPQAAQASPQAAAGNSAPQAPAQVSYVDDPHNPNLLVSNDVLEYEQTRLQALLKQAKTPEERDEILLRLNAITPKLQMLVIMIQTGKMDENAYGELVQGGYSRDLEVLAQLNKAGKKKDAEIVAKRLKLMANELTELGMEIPKRSPVSGAATASPASSSSSLKGSPSPLQHDQQIQQQQQQPHQQQSQQSQVQQQMQNQQKMQTSQSVKSSSGSSSNKTTSGTHRSSGSNSSSSHVSRKGRTDHSAERRSQGLSADAQQECERSSAATSTDSKKGASGAGKKGSSTSSAAGSEAESERRRRELEPLTSQWNKRIAVLEKEVSVVKQKEPNNKAKLVELMRELRALQMNLIQVLQAIQDPSIPKPLIKMSMLQYQSVKVNRDVDLNCLEFSFVSFSDLNVKTPVFFSGAVQMNETMPLCTYETEVISVPTGTFRPNKFLMKITRDKSALARFAKRRLSLDVCTSSGLIFKKKEKQQSVSVPLEQLNTCCDAEVVCPLHRGTVTVRLRLRTPVQGPEVSQHYVSEYILASPVETPTGREVYERLAKFYGEHTDELCSSGTLTRGTAKGTAPVQPQLQPSQPRTTATAAEQTRAQPPPRKGPAPPQRQQASKAPRQGGGAQASQPASARPAQGKSALPSAEELFDPTRIVSNNVLEAEQGFYEAEIAKAKSARRDTAELENNLSVVNGRLTMLITMIQNGNMTFEQYKDMVSTQIKQDTETCKQLGAAGRKDDARRLLKRIKIMKEELEE